MHYYTILVDDLWHKLCNFLSVMGGFNVLDRRGEDIVYGENREGGGTPIYWLNGYVPLERVWFSSHWVW